MSFWQTRKHNPSEQISGGMVRIRYGDFGSGSPAYAFADVDPLGLLQFRAAGLYSYHEGDLFTPGTGNFVFEPNYELPLQTIWGNAFLRTPNTFNPLQHPQVWSQPNVFNNGIGGLEAGQLELQPLLAGSETGDA